MNNTTEIKIADAQQLIDVMKELKSSGVEVTQFYSTDSKPEIWVTPSQELSRYALDHSIMNIDIEGELLMKSIEKNGVIILWLNQVVLQQQARRSH